MDRSSRKSLAWSIGAHTLLLVLLIAIAGVAHKPRELEPTMMTMVNVAPDPVPGPVTGPQETITAVPDPTPPVVEAPPPSIPPDVEPAPVEDPPIEKPPIIEPTPKPKPDDFSQRKPDPPPKKELKPTPPVVKKEVVKPPLKKIPTKEVKPTQTSPKEPPRVKVQISNTVVRRPVASASTPKTTTNAKPRSSPSSSADEKAIAAGIASSILGKTTGRVTLDVDTGSSDGKGDPSEFGWYFNLIKEQMYAAWEPPKGLPDGTSAQVTVRIEKSGAISHVSLATSSGNKLMDESAMTAATRVKKLPRPLPKGLGNDSAEVTIRFRIQK